MTLGSLAGLLGQAKRVLGWTCESIARERLSGPCVASRKGGSSAILHAQYITLVQPVQDGLRFGYSVAIDVVVFLLTTFKRGHVRKSKLPDGANFRYDGRRKGIHFERDVWSHMRGRLTFGRWHRRRDAGCRQRDDVRRGSRIDRGSRRSHRRRSSFQLFCSRKDCPGHRASRTVRASASPAEPRDARRHALPPNVLERELPQRTPA